jgi:hypothetical protein
MNEDKNKTEVSVETKPKKKFNTKKLKYGSLSVIVTVITVAVVVLINIAVGVLSDTTNLNLDLTSEQLYEISQQTEDYLAKVTQDIEILVTMKETDVSEAVHQYANYYKQAYEIMRKYAQANSHIKLRFVDVNLNPQELDRFDVVYQGNIGTGMVVVSLLDGNGNPTRVKVLSFQTDLFNQELNQNYQQVIASSRAEQVLTTAIMYITDVNPKHAYLMSTESADIQANANILKMLSDNGYETGEWDPNLEAIPEDMDLLIIDNPLNDFSESVITQIYNYLENGGNYGKNLVYLANNAQKSTPNINNFLKEWGLSPLQGEYIGEMNQQNILSSATQFWFKSNVTPNDYTTGMSNTNIPIAAFAPVPIDILFETQNNVNVVPLVYTDETAYVVDEAFIKEREENQSAEPRTGKFCIMAVSNKYTFDDSQKMILSNVLVLGSSEMLQESVTALTYYSNGEYFISAVNTMTGKTAGIIVSPKVDDTGGFEVTLANFQSAMIVFMIALPLVVLVTGAVVLLRRRHK